MNSVGFDRPTLMVDKAKCLANIEFMVSKANKKGLTLRPHYKTHQNATIGKWFQDFGVEKIAVSSVPMAQYFANNGWNDITIAFPFTIQQAENINVLAKKVKLQLVVSSVINAIKLEKVVDENLGVFLEIDTGHGRSGFKSTDIDEITKSVDIISSKTNLRFCGFLSHAGQTYSNKPKKVEEIHRKAIEKLVFLKNLFIEDFPSITISYGDTPSSVISENFEGIDELRPGNYVFFDMQQSANGICKPSQIAAVVVCPVVALYPSKSSAIIWGGAIHLSKDSYTLPSGVKSFGLICKLRKDNTWSEPIDGLYIESVSQEHGLIKATNSQALNKIHEGDLVAVLPAHICLVVDCLGEIFIPGEGMVSCFK